MKEKKNNFLLYLILVVIPICLATFFYFNELVRKDEEKRINHAHWIADIHQRSWHQFITETMTSLEVISMTAETINKQTEDIEPLLKRVHFKDPRYGGVYLLNSNGRVIAGSDAYLKNENLSNKEYIKNVLTTKDAIISSEKETFPNGQRVVGLAIPVLDKENKLLSVLVAFLRIDYIENVMKILTPEEKLYVLNDKNLIVMKLNIDGYPNIHAENWYTLPIDRLPWKIRTEIGELKATNIMDELLTFFFFALIVSHILFLLIKYYLLKRQAAKDRQQNDIQKLELVGTLAASTAHEIRNPLTGIQGLIQLLNEKHKNEEDQFYFSVIKQEINRINQIVNEFLILGKPTALKKERMDMRIIFEELHPLITSEANLLNIQWNCSLPSEPIFVEWTKDQMKQVILNIIKNAFESMSFGGILNIDVHNESGKCKILIKDTGIGIPKEKLGKIFDPFYTSKENGTGLGLVVCKRIVDSFGGSIHIFSEENKGTSVEILLPLSNDKNI